MLLLHRSLAGRLHTSQAGADSPVSTWHQGGPGGSSIDVGLYTEMGYFQISDEGTFVNKFAWNRVSHMLYLESPAGSGQSAGYSTCEKGGQQVPCSWDDVSQAEAYAHALAAFYRAFPEYKANDLYLTGESYFGQCVRIARPPATPATPSPFPSRFFLGPRSPLNLAPPHRPMCQVRSKYRTLDPHPRAVQPNAPSQGYRRRQRVLGR